MNNSINKYTTCIELSPNIQNSFIFRANSYLYLNQYDKALEDLNKIQNLENQGFDFYWIYLKVLMKKEEYDKASVIIEKCLKKFSNDKTAVHSLFSFKEGIYSVENEMSKSIETFLEIIKLHSEIDIPSHIKAADFYNLGNRYLALEKYSLALVNYTKAIDLDPNYTSAFANRSTCNSALEKYDEALNDINKAITLKPQWNYYMIRAKYIHLPIRDINNAELDINKALELNPSCDECYSKRGSIKMEKGMYKEALHDYENAIEYCQNKNMLFNVDYIFFQYGRVEARLKLKEYETALREISELTDFFDIRLKKKNYEGAEPICSDAYHYKAQALYYLGHDDYCQYFEIACKLGSEASCKNSKMIGCK